MHARYLFSYSFFFIRNYTIERWWDDFMDQLNARPPTPVGPKPPAAEEELDSIEIRSE
jgi:hypothetical protein